MGRTLLFGAAYIRRTVSLALLACACLPAGATLPDQEPGKASVGKATVPAVTAEAAIVVDALEGRILWSHNADRRMYPASLTKMLTCAVALEESADTSRMVTIAPEVAAVPETGLALATGERLPLLTLIEAALIYSANDAAAAVAQGTSGNVAAFVELMNRRAAEWGARNSHFANPHGLHSEQHWSTARDLAIIARHAMSIPQFEEIAAMKQVTIRRPARVAANPGAAVPTIGSMAEPRVFHTRNRLLNHWDLCDGIKTGYTRHAGRCLASSATGDGWRAICIVLQSKDIWSDSRALLTWALQNHELRTVVTAGKGEWQTKVHDGVDRQVACLPDRDVVLVQPRSAPRPELRAVLDPVTAPVSATQPVGRLEVVVGGRTRKTVALVAAEDVELSLWGRIKHESIPGPYAQLLLCVAAGVLLIGTAAKATCACRNRLPSRRRADHPVGQSDH